MLIHSLLIASQLLLVHDQRGWFHPHCCGDDDCLPVPCEEITDDGKSYVYDNMKFSGVYPSQNNKCYACIGNRGGQPMHPHCLYIQQSS